jgi:enamidase
VVVLDAPVGGVASSALDALREGDAPGVALVAVAGDVLVKKSRVTPPPAREVELSD